MRCSSGNPVVSAKYRTVSSRQDDKHRKGERNAQGWLWAAFASCCKLAERHPGPESEVRLEITARDPAYEGRSFGDHGSYERIRAIAHMRIDPKDPANTGIVDLDLAPRAADGMVEYDVDVVILRPAEPARARRVMVYDVVNRGIMLLGMLNQGASPWAIRSPKATAS